MNQNALMQLVPWLVIMGIFYILIIRPQHNQVKERGVMLKNLKTGDKVLTNGGIVGLITGINADELEVEIAKNVKVTMVRTAVAGLVGQKIAA